jgi:hypothetical protein
LRSAPIYEITERDDEYLPMTNPLIGHYVWYMKCKRFEYSYEPGIPLGPANIQLNDSEEYGRLEGGTNPAEVVQPYEGSVQKAGDEIYDNPVTHGLLQLIQTTNPDEECIAPEFVIPNPLDLPVPTPLPSDVKLVQRRANSAYDYFDKDL